MILLTVSLNPDQFVDKVVVEEVYSISAPDPSLTLPSSGGVTSMRIPSPEKVAERFPATSVTRTDTK